MGRLSPDPGLHHLLELQALRNRGPMARLLNALAGGVHHYAADRELAERIESASPGISAQVNTARRFHGQLSEWAVREAGVRGLMIAGAGYPGPWDATAAALAADPGVRAVYLDPDAEATAVNAALLGSERITAGMATLLDPSGLMSDPAIRALPRPWLLLMRLTAQWLPPDAAATLAGAYGRLLPPGSVLAMTTIIPGPGKGGDELVRLLSQAGGEAYAHQPSDLENWFSDAGLKILPPGVVDVRAWPDRGWAEAAYARRQGGRVIAAVARVP